MRAPPIRGSRGLLAWFVTFAVLGVVLGVETVRLNAIRPTHADALWIVGWSSLAYGLAGLAGGALAGLLLRLVPGGSPGGGMLRAHSAVAVAVATTIAARAVPTLSGSAWWTAFALAAGAVLGAVLAPGWAQDRSQRFGFGVAAVALGLLTSSRALPREVVGRAEPRISAAARRPVLVVGVDGFDPELVDSLIARGELPNVARLVRNGAYARLATLTPTYSPPIWTTIATGQTPQTHGILGFVAYSFPGLQGSVQSWPLRTGFARFLNSAVDVGLARRAPVTTTLRRSPALWNVATRAGKRVGVVNWWPSWPVENVNGVVVSDRFWYRLQRTSGRADGRGSTTSPAALESELGSLAVRPADLPETLPAAVTGERSRAESERGVLRGILAADLTYQRVSERLLRQDAFDLFMVYFRGADALGHLGSRLIPAERREVADTTRFQEALASYYRALDERIGSLIELSGAKANVVICSDHGFAWSRAGIGNHDVPTPGVLLLSGPDIRPAARLADPSVRDVAPTILSLMGLPAARDMPGRALVEAIDARAVASAGVIDSYGSWTPEGSTTSENDEEIRDALRALGYLGGR